MFKLEIKMLPNKLVKFTPGLRPCAGRLASPAAPYLKR